MKPFVKMAEAQTADGEKWEFWERAGLRFLTLDGVLHASCSNSGVDEAMVGYGVSPVVRANRPAFLFAGVGLGFALAAATRAVHREKARFVVAEPCRELVEWNRTLLADIHPGLWEDARISVESSRADETARKNPDSFHAIFLNFLHGPCALNTQSAGDYFGALKQGGLLVVSLPRPDKKIENLLRRAGFDVSTADAPISGKSRRPRFHTLTLGRRGRYISSHQRRRSS